MCPSGFRKIYVRGYDVHLIPLEREAKDIAEKLLEEDRVHIVSHIDADGITAASIACASLERAGVNATVGFVKQLEEREISRIKKEKHPLVWFTDLGSGQLEGLGDIRCVISDHHEPRGTPSPGLDRGNILSYLRTEVLELNPHRFGIDGSTEISGAGVTYLIGKHMGDNVDLSKLAIIGAVGDMQASAESKLVGVNRKILAEAEEGGYVNRDMDIQLYGRESRPLHKLLEFASDPILPGLSGDENGCTRFLEDLGIPLRSNGEWRRWYHLDKTERRTIISAMADRMLDRGYPAHYPRSLVGEVYTFPGEEPGTMLHEAKEFSTLLNSCGRYMRGKVGMEVCLGDRNGYLKEAYDLLKGHQRVLVDCMRMVESKGLTEREYLQYFHGENFIPETVLGTVAGMLLGGGKAKRSIPVIGFAFTEEDEGVKVSSRGTKDLVEAGLDLGAVMNQSSKLLGGEGGGHAIAAGAFIPLNSEVDFLDLAENMIRGQLG